MSGGGPSTSRCLEHPRRRGLGFGNAATPSDLIQGVRPRPRLQWSPRPPGTSKVAGWMLRGGLESSGKDAILCPVRALPRPRRVPPKLALRGFRFFGGQRLALLRPAGRTPLSFPGKNETASRGYAPPFPPVKTFPVEHSTPCNPFTPRVSSRAWTISALVARFSLVYWLPFGGTRCRLRRALLVAHGGCSGGTARFATATLRCWITA